MCLGWGAGWGGGACHVFFIYVDCLNVSQGRDGGWSYGSSKPRVPGSEKKREGQKEKEGGQPRRYKRCSVFSGKRERDVGTVGGFTV